MKNLLNGEFPVAVVSGIAVSFGLFTLILTLSGKTEITRVDKPPVVIDLLTWQSQPKKIQPVQKPKPAPVPVKPKKKKLKKKTVKPRPKKTSPLAEKPLQRQPEPLVEAVAPQPEPEKPLEQPAADPSPAPVPLFKLTKIPHFLHKELPVYPESMRSLGKTATVLLEILIDKTGKVANVTVVKSGGEDFDQAAKEAFMRSSFTPAEMEGKAVPVLLRQSVTFQLN